jgi:hypothetical protein
MRMTATDEHGLLLCEVASLRSTRNTDEKPTEYTEKQKNKNLLCLSVCSVGIFFKRLEHVRRNF